MAFRLRRKNKSSKTLENKIPGSSVTVGTVGRSKFSLGKIKTINRKKKIILVLAAFLAVAGLYSLFRAVTNDDGKKVVVVCRGELLIKAADVLNDSKVAALEPIVQEVQALPNYDQDPNCLNIVTTFYIHISDYKNARSQLDKLEKVYDDDTGFSSKLGNDAKTMIVMRLNVEFLGEQAKRFQDGIGRPPSPRVDQ